MFKKISRNISWNPDWCKFCDLCEKNCVKKGIKFDKELKVDDEKCIACGICEKVCPDMAIKVEK
jgi:2-oxoglutarate ferredoxin oxidoreductase subunit delta